jgi:hypothetical protein
MSRIRVRYDCEHWPRCSRPYQALSTQREREQRTNQGTYRVPSSISHPPKNSPIEFILIQRRTHSPGAVCACLGLYAVVCPRSWPYALVWDCTQSSALVRSRIHVFGTIHSRMFSFVAVHIRLRLYTVVRPRLWPYTHVWDCTQSYTLVWGHTHLFRTVCSHTHVFVVVGTFSG